MYDLKLGKDVMKRYVSTVGGRGRYACKLFGGLHMYAHDSTNE